LVYYMLRHILSSGFFGFHAEFLGLMLEKIHAQTPFRTGSNYEVD
jgi:hypothetical protein